MGKKKPKSGRSAAEQVLHNIHHNPSVLRTLNPCHKPDVIFRDMIRAIRRGDTDLLLKLFGIFVSNIHVTSGVGRVATRDMENVAETVAKVITLHKSDPVSLAQLEKVVERCRSISLKYRPKSS